MKILFTSVTVLFATAVRAAVPQSIDYQAYLTDAMGTAQQGSVTVTASIYAQAIGGAALWSDILAVDADNGLIGLALGRSGNPFPEDLFEAPRWVGIAVAPDAEMTPRRELKAVAYSLKSDDADSVQGLQPSEIINAATGAQYKFVGFSSASVNVFSGVGFLALTQACRDDFGADARMATSAEVLKNPIAGGSGGWVLPTHLVFEGNTYIEVPSMARGTSTGGPHIMNCDQWTGGGTPSQGLAVTADYEFEITLCDTKPVACAAP